MIQYNDENPLAFCLEHAIRIEPKYTCVFLRYGLVEVNCRYEDYDHDHVKTLVAALRMLCDLANTPIDPRVGVFNMVVRHGI